MTSETYNQLEAQFRPLFERYTGHLDEETRAYVKHYVDHSELEMAYELFGLGLMSKIATPPHEAKELLEMGCALGLDKETVYEDDFWETWEHFLQV